jgi:hypothetical protein
MLAEVRVYCCWLCVENSCGTHPVYSSENIGFFLWGSVDGSVKLTAWLHLMLLRAFVAGVGMDCFDGILF